MRLRLFFMAGLLFLLCGPLLAQRPLGPLLNPDRGWHFEVYPTLVDSNGVATYPNKPSFVTDSYSIPTLISAQRKTFETGKQEPRHITMAQCYIYLTKFVGRKISPKALLTIDSVFQTHRKAGVKMILRFAYDYETTAGSPGYAYARFSDIYRHLDQLAPIIQKNAGIIHTWQAGMIGAWGEWHTTARTYPGTGISYDLKASPDSIRTMISKMLDILPKGGTIQVRTTKYRASMGLPEDKLYRIGLHNDYFTAGIHPYAGGNDYVGADAAYAAERSPYILLGGEIPYAGNGDPWFLNDKMPVKKALQIFRDQHFSWLDISQNYEVNITNWKSYRLTEDSLNAAGIPFHPEYFKDYGFTVPRTMYQFVRDHFGYSLFFDYNKDVIQTAGGKVSFSIPFRNYGFSRVYNRYKVVAYVLNNTDQKVAETTIEADPSDWNPFRPGDASTSRMQHYLQGAVPLPSGLATGNYKIGFAVLPLSPDVAADTAFSIRFANRTNLRYALVDGNVVNVSHAFSYDTTARYCVPTSNTDGQERYFTKLWTEGAIQNIDLNTPLKPSKAYAIADQTIRVKQGSAFNLNAITTDDSKYSRIRAWVDWNGDGSFADNSDELIFAIGNPNTENSALLKNFVQNIGIPSNARVGKTVMRIRFYQAWQSNPGPCGYQIQNTTFDFPVYVDSSTVTSPAAPANCVASGDGSADDRYPTSIRTQNALHDLAIVTPLRPLNGYRSYIADYLSVFPGAAFDLIGTSSDQAKASQIRAWADWNGDGIFADDASEILFDLGKHAPTAADSAAHNAAIRHFSQSILVPTGAKLGQTRIRIRYYDAQASYPGSCGFSAKSTTFDFQVKVETPEGKAYCLAGSDGKDQDRYLTSLSTTGAVHNFNVPAAALKPLNGYQAYREDAVTVTPASTFQLLGTSTQGTMFNRISLWIDWDGSGSFESNESIFSLGVQNANDNGSAVLNFNQPILVPLTARPGMVRARIRNHNSWYAVPGPCGDAPSTTTFDFLINVANTTYCAATAPDSGYAPGVYLKSFTTAGAAHNLNVISDLKPLGGYRLYDGDRLFIHAGGTFSLHATTSDDTKWAQVRAWVDWNGDGKFEDGSGEDLFSFGNLHSDVPTTAMLDFLRSINVPASAKMGNTRLRLRFWNGWTTYPGPCDYQGWSSTVDFPVTILGSGAVVCKPETDETVFAPNVFPTTLSTSGAAHNLAITSELRPQRGYRLYDNDILAVNAGSTFSLHATTSELTKWAQMRAWIDWNGDGIFEDGNGEDLFSLGEHLSDGTSTVVRDFLQSIKVPATAKAGYTRLRMRFWNSWVDYPGACSPKDQSTTFDFTVQILPLVTATCKPETEATNYAPAVSLTSFSTTGAVHDLSLPSPLGLQKGYRLYENDVLTVTAGSTVSLHATASDGTKFSQMRAWTDWNRDGVFTDGSNEELFTAGTFLSTGVDPEPREFSRTVSIPATAKPGYTRLRMRFWNSWVNYPGPCNLQAQSGTFDFPVLILPPQTTICKPETDDTIYAPAVSLTSFSTTGALHNLNVTSPLTLQRGYRFYENDVLAVTAGSTVSLHGIASEGTKFSQMRAWTDWNRDGAFTDGSNEELFTAGTFLSTGVDPEPREFSRSVTIPATANPGYTRLRMRFWNSWVNYPGPCNLQGQSGTFDFTVFVLPSGTTTYSVPVSSYREAAPADVTDFTGILYPSPVGQKPLHVQLSQPVSGQADMQLFDVSGHAIAKQEVLLRNGLLEEDVRSLKPGLYFLVLKVNGKSLTFRFVKE